MTETKTRARDDLVALGREVAGRRPRGSGSPGAPTPPGPPRPRRRPLSPGADGGRLPGRVHTRWIVLAVVLVVVVLATWIVAFSSLLAAGTVRITGTHRLTSAQVVAAAEVRSGTPLVRIRKGAIQRRVEQLPDVLSASVSVSFPSTVVISVVERTASGVLKLEGGRWALVDETGHQFNTVNTRPVGLPRLAPATVVTEDPALLATTLSAMAQVAVSVPPALRTKVTQVSATGPTNVTLLLADLRTVVWGASEQNAEKARVLPALLARPGRIYNISDPLRPYTRAN